MCGAFSILHPFREVSARFNAGYGDSWDSPRYNVRPSQPIPVIFNTNLQEIKYAIWGVHPHYDKTNKMFFINARSDSLNKPTWKKMLYEQRCLIPADGFYEWQKMNNSPEKVPYRFELKDKELFAFAGLWQLQKDSSGNTVPHCVIITTEPNKTVGEIHDRMPAILHKNDERTWLDPDTDIETLLSFLKPYPDSFMQKYKISNKVNSPKNDSEEILIPIDDE